MTRMAEALTAGTPEQVPDDRRAEQRRAYNREWNRQNREKMRAARKRYDERFPGREAALARARHIANPEVRRKQWRDHYAKNPEKGRAKRWWQKYRLTPTQYMQLVRRPCDICGGYNPNRKNVVDHCHTTGRLRGILCTRCNTALGKFDDNPERLTKAVIYLQTANLDQEAQAK